MADYAIPKSGVAYIFYGCLVSQADTKLFKSGPTLAAGDFKVSIDGGAFANLATLPTNTPGTFAVKFSLSAAEMTGDNILIVASDVAGAEWCDQCWNIQTSPRGIADLAFPTVSGRSLDVSVGGEAGLDWANIGSPTTAVALTNTILAGTITGTAQAGAANTITLAAGSSAVDGLYDPALISIIGGTGANQSRMIVQYTGSTKVAAVDRDWRTNPDNTSIYIIIPLANLISTNEGLATGGGASTITLNANASATDNFYNGQYVVLRSSTGQDQTRLITSYVGATKVATVSAAWATNPASGTGYMIFPAYLAALSNLDAAVSSRMATYTQPTGFLAATFPATVASTTNITAGTITNLTNAPTAGDFTAVMKTSIGTAVAASAVASVTGNVGGNVTGSVGSVVGLTAANLDVAVSTRLATAGYTAPPATDVIADRILNRNVAGGSDAGRLVKESLYVLRNRTNIAAGTLTVYGTDDSTAAFTAVVSTTAGDPISGIDPA